MSRSHWTDVLILAVVAGCDSAVTGTADAVISLQITVADLATLASLDEGRIRIEGPTARVVTITPGTTQTIDGLQPGTYNVALEGLAGGEVEVFGETAGVAVTAGHNTSVTVAMNSFVPAFLTLPASSFADQTVSIQFGPVNGAVLYRVEWATSPSFTGARSTETSTTGATISMDVRGTNFVRVRALNRFGSLGRASSNRSIEVLDPAPVLSAAPANLAFTAEAGGPAPAVQTLSIANAGGGTLAWSVSDDATWLTLSPASGTQAGTVSVNVSTAGLAEGPYDALITVTGNASNAPLSVPVHLTLTRLVSAPAIGVSPVRLDFSAQEAGPNPADQALSIRNDGGGTLSWAASDNASWLTLSPTSGTNAGSVTASVSTTGLKAGTYGGVITVTGNTANSPVSVPISLTVLQGPIITVNPTTLSFTADEGGPSPPAAALAISNSGAGSLGWTIVDDASWLSVSPSNGVDGASVTVDVNSAGLGAGTYNATIRVSGNASNSPVGIPVTLQVKPPPGPTIASYTAVLLSLNDSTACSNNGSLFEHSFSYSDPGGSVSTAGSVINGAFLFSSGTSGTFTTSPRTVSGPTTGVLTYRRCTVFGSSTQVNYSATLTDDQGRTSNQVSVVIPKPTGANGSGALSVNARVDVAAGTSLRPTAAGGGSDRDPDPDSG